MAIDHAPARIETKDLSESHSTDNGSLNLLSLADNSPFKSNTKASPSEMYATNSGCYEEGSCTTTDVPPDMNQNQHQNQWQRQNQGQWQKGGDQNTSVDNNVKNNNAVDTRVGVKNQVGVNNEVGVNNNVGVRSDNQNHNVANGGDGGNATGGNAQGGEVRFNQQITNKSQALGLARSPILVNQCSELAVQLGGGAGFIHGDVGFMKANENCMNAILQDAQCSGVESIARANMLTAQSALMFPENTDSGRQVQRQMAQATLDLAEKCAGVEISGKQPVETAKPEVSRKDLQQLEQRTNEKLDRAFYHAIKK